MDLDHDLATCVCLGPLEPLGQLGRLWWYRCRDCGMDHSSECSPEELLDFESPDW
jgi:hypothetical protein